MRERPMKRIRQTIFLFALISVFLTGCFGSTPETAATDAETVKEAVKEDAKEKREKQDEKKQTDKEKKRKSEKAGKKKTAEKEKKRDQDRIPEFKGEAYVEVNHNEPYFKKSEITDKSFEEYSSLDSLGRCGTAESCIGTDLMPTKDRGGIGMVKPSGWHTVKYDCVSGKYLYNRCHLIGYQLTAENANEENLITGTRYLNIEGMLPFENMVADYVKETDHHVMYRVTPVFKGKNLTANGVLMEGYSVEDKGEGICFCVYAFNAQPGVKINYKTGESHLKGEKPGENEQIHEKTEKSNEKTGVKRQERDESGKYILNTDSMKFHRPECYSAGIISDENRKVYNGSRKKLIRQGYEPCGRCHP